jgi:TP901 family phage tail tape measure protein
MAFDAGAIVARMELALTGWTKSVETVKADQQSMTGFALRHSDEIQKLGVKFAAAGAVITGALSAIVLKTVESEHEFGHMSEKTGMTTEELSRLALSAKKGDTDIGSMTMGLKFLATQMIATAGATDKQSTVLGAMGISATDAAGKLRPFSDILPEIADHFKGMEDGAVKVKLAVALFGRAGMDLIPVMNMGSAGFKENAELASRFGTVVSKEAAKAAAEFKDKLIDLQASGAGLTHALGEALMPAAEKLIAKLTDTVVKVKDWIKENPALVKGVLEFAGGLGIAGTAAGTFLVVLANIVKALAILKIHAATPILITVGIVGGVAVGEALLKIREFYEKEVSHKFVDSATADWAALGLRMGETTGTITAIKSEFYKLDKDIMDNAELTATLTDVWEKYGGSFHDVLTAILKGEAGAKAKEILIGLMDAHGGAAQAAEYHAAATDKVTDASKKLDPSLQAVLDALDKGNKSTKDAVTIDNTFLGVSRDLTKALWDMGVAVKDAGLKLENTFLPPARDMRIALFEMGVSAKGAGLQIVDTLLPAMRQLPKEVQAMIPGFKNMGAEWGKVNSQIAADFIRSVGSILTGQTTFKDGFKSLMSSITNSFISGFSDLLKDGKSATEALNAAISTTPGVISLVVTAVNILVASIEAYKKQIAAFDAQALKGAMDSVKQSVAFLGPITDELAKKMYDYSRSNSQAATEAKFLGDMMRETGIDAHNFDIYLAKATNTLTLYETGALSAADATELANDQFGQLLEAAKKLGKEGSEAMINFIKTAQAAGLEVASINAYVIEQLDKVPDALSVMITAAGDSAEALAGLGDIALLTFDSMIRAGVPYRQAIEKLGGAFAPLLDEHAALLEQMKKVDVGTDAYKKLAEALALNEDKMKKLGFGSGGALDEMMKVVNITREHKDLFDAIEANDTVMKALSNSGSLMGESGAKAFKKLEDNANSYYNQLLAAGMTEGQAQAAMKQSLQDIYDASVANGIPLDENTQKLVDQAKKAGLVKDKVDMGQVATDTLTVLGKIADMFETWLRSLGLIVGKVGEMGRAIGDLPSLPNIPDPGAPGQPPPGTCFVYGTPVTMADGSKRPGEQVKIDDPVRAYDTETGEFLTDYVDAVIVHEAGEVKRLVWINGIGVTPEHPFWINGVWKQVGDAQVGDHLISDSGWVVDVMTKTWGPGGVKVWNLTLRGKTHDYFAGGVLVHNVAKKPEYDLGGFVPFTGPAIVHAGEYVIPPDQVAAMSRGGGGGAGAAASAGMTVNITQTINAQKLDRQTIRDAGELLGQEIKFQLSRLGFQNA